MEAEIGGMWTSQDAKECVQAPEAGRGEEGFSPRASNNLISDFWAPEF